MKQKWRSVGLKSFRAFEKQAPSAMGQQFHPRYKMVYCGKCCSIRDWKVPKCKPKCLVKWKAPACASAPSIGRKIVILIAINSQWEMEQHFPDFQGKRDNLTRNKQIFGNFFPGIFIPFEWIVFLNWTSLLSHEIFVIIIPLSKTIRNFSWRERAPKTFPRSMESR